MSGWFSSFRALGGLIALLTLNLTACLGPSSPVRPPEEFEKETFSAISSFYCEYKRWPSDWSEFREFLVAIGKGETLAEDYPDARLESPRAVLATLEYKGVLGAPKRVSFIAPPYCEEPGDERDVSMCGGRVRLRLPKDFWVMGGVAVKERWRAPPFPDAAWKSKSGGYFIAVRFDEVPLEPSAVSGFKQPLEAAYETSIPSLKWLVREVVESGGRTFLAHEYESDSTRGRIVTVLISTSFDGKLLTINVGGPAEGRSQVEEIARKITNSLRLK